jgi:hypothetical protein
MIIQPTREQTRRILRKTYSGPGFGSRSFACLGLGMGLGIGLGSGLGVPGGGPLSSQFAPGTLVLAMQSDIGVTYDTAVTLNAGGTSTSVVTLGGTLTNAQVPVLVKATNSATVGSGATFDISYDGGSTFAMTGVTPTAATPVALTGTGIGAGRTLTWAAGTGVTNDTWEAYAAGWADGATSPHNATATTAAKRPKITVGTGGKPGLLGNGTSTAFTTTLILPQPSVTPTHIYVVGRAPTNPASNRCIAGAAGGASIFFGIGTGPVLNQYDGTFANSSAFVANTWYAFQGGFTGGVSDYTKAGSAVAVNGGNAGNNTPAAGVCLLSANVGFYANFEILAVWIANQPIATCAPGLAAAVTAWCGVTQV